jgi:RNA polymerase sigma-70 factor, ECF subfamily
MSDRTLPPRPPRIDYATLLAAVAVGRSAVDGLSHREACKRILAQVYRVVAAVLRPDAPDIKDATHDAFMRVHSSISKFVHNPENPGGPTAWVNTIALHAALDRRRDERPEDEGDFDDIEHETNTDLDEALDRAKLAAVLLDQLDERHRAVLILRYWSGQTDEEIADTLRIPLGTVKTRARAARNKLREYANGVAHLRHLFVAIGDVEEAEA